MIRRRLLLGVAFVALFVLGWWVGRGGARTDAYAQQDLLVEVLERVRKNYVDPVDTEKLIHAAVRGMLRGLDPYSQYLEPRQYQQLQSVTEGKFGGIGVVVGVRDNFPTVISPIEGTPAWEAGLIAGDVIVGIDGQSTLNLTIDEVADRLRGSEGTQVGISVRREGEEQDHDFTLTRRMIVTKSVPYAFQAAPGIGYVRLADFSEKSGSEVRAAVARLRAAGAERFILDLRSNPGGLLTQAVDVSEEFLPRGTMVVYTHGRIREQDQRFYSSEPHPLVDLPMVVLVDPASASASEIVAGSLQDLDRALVIGRPTYGKGSVQSVFPLKGRNGALKLTTALYYTPSGRSLHRPPSDTARVDDEDETPAPPSDTARAAAPTFRTAAGRVVTGGGGVTPDLIVKPDSASPLVTRVEQRGLALRFATRWANTHPDGVKPNATVPWPEFQAWLEEQKLPATRAEIERDRPTLERVLRREFARRCCGDSAAVREFLAGDPPFQRAIEVLSRSRHARDVFAAAGLARLPARRTGR